MRLRQGAIYVTPFCTSNIIWIRLFELLLTVQSPSPFHSYIISLVVTNTFSANEVFILKIKRCYLVDGVGRRANIVDLEYHFDELCRQRDLLLLRVEGLDDVHCFHVVGTLKEDINNKLLNGDLSIRIRRDGQQHDKGHRL